MKRILAALLLALSVGPALAAGTSVFPIAPGTVTTSPIAMITSGTTIYGIQAQCDPNNNCVFYTGGTVPTSTFVSNATPLGPAAPASANPVTPSNQPVGTGSFATAQVTVGPVATAISVLSARTGVAGTGRVAATVVNTTTNDVWLGTTSGVTSLTGVLLPGIKGASVTLNTTAAIFGTSTTSSLLTAAETF